MSNRSDHPNPTPQCAAYQQQISDYLSGSKAALTAPLQRHVATCPACTNTLRAFRQLDHRIASLPTPASSRRVQAGVLHAIEQAEGKRRDLELRGSAGRGPSWAVSLVAMVALLGFASVLATMFASTQPGANNGAEASPVIGTAVSKLATDTPSTPTIASTFDSLTDTRTLEFTPTPASNDAIIAVNQSATISDSTSAAGYVLARLNPQAQYATIPGKKELASLPAIGAGKAAYLVASEPAYIEVADLVSDQLKTYPAPADLSRDYAPEKNKPLVASFAPDGKQMLVARSGSEVLLYDLVAGSYTKVEGTAGQKIIGWASPAIFYLYSGAGLARYMTAEKPVRMTSAQFTLPDRSVDDLLLSADGKTIYYSTLSNEQYVIKRFDGSDNIGNSRVVATADNGATLGSFSLSADGSSLVYVVYTNRSDKTGGGGVILIKRLDLKSGKTAGIGSLIPDSGVGGVLACGSSVYFSSYAPDTRSANGSSNPQITVIAADGRRDSTSAGELVGCAP